MNVYFILREDLEYTSENLFNLAIKGTQKLNFHIDNYEVLMIYNRYFLLKLEEFLINMGISFEWIDIDNQSGIIIYTKENIRDTYLGDCIKLKQFAYYRDLEITIENE